MGSYNHKRKRFVGKRTDTKLNSSGLADNLNAMLSEYTDGVLYHCEDLIYKYGSKMVQELKKGEGLPSRESHTIKWYLGNWRCLVSDMRTGVEAIVYNRYPGLAHLLENGHATKNGGRTRAFPHIRPVEERIIEEFFDAVKQKIGEG